MLTGKQKRMLRGMGMTLPPIAQIGKGGVSESAAAGVAQALAARELIKVRVLPNCPLTPREGITALAAAAEAELVQVIGRNGLLYKRNEENPRIIVE